MKPKNPLKLHGARPLPEKAIDALEHIDVSRRDFLKTAGVMMIATAMAVRAMASKCRRCSTGLSLSPNAELKTATNWKPNRAWIPGNTMRHSSSRYSAALERGSSSFFSSVLFGRSCIRKQNCTVQSNVSKTRKNGVRLCIPGFGHRHIHTLLSVGTIIKDQLVRLADLVEIHILTADKRGKSRDSFGALPVPRPARHGLR